MFWKRREQPKEDHPSVYSDILCKGDEGIQPSPTPFVFLPDSDLWPYLPDFAKPVAAFTPLELAAKKEYVRRRLASGATYSDHSEMFCLDGTLGEMAEKLGLPPSDKHVIPSTVPFSRVDPDLISEEYR